MAPRPLPPPALDAEERQSCWAPLRRLLSVQRTHVRLNAEDDQFDEGVALQPVAAPAVRLHREGASFSDLLYRHGYSARDALADLGITAVPQLLAAGFVVFWKDARNSAVQRVPDEATWDVLLSRVRGWTVDTLVHSLSVDTVLRVAACGMSAAQLGRVLGTAEAPLRGMLHPGMLAAYERALLVATPPVPIRTFTADEWTRVFGVSSATCRLYGLRPTEP